MVSGPALLNLRLTVLLRAALAVLVFVRLQNNVKNLLSYGRWQLLFPHDYLRDVFWK